MGYIIRKKTIKDIKDIAHITTLAWNQTYKDIIDKAFLNKLKENEDERVEKSTSSFDENNNSTFVLEVDGKVVGFSKCTISEYPDYEGIGEIQSLYILDGYKGYGYGKELFKSDINYLKSKGYDSFIVNCLNGNKSNYFYMHMGGEKIGNVTLTFDNKLYEATVYLFKID